MSDIFFFNTLTKRKEKFIPLDVHGNQVKIYSCGPTVYSSPHIGNFRAFVFADLLRATLRHLGGYTVRHVMNITDVGHLTDDGDQGEDKMEKGAQKEGLSVRQIARKYEGEFYQSLKLLSIEPFDEMPRATSYIKEQIEMVKKIIKKGYTYVIPGDGIYMDTQKIGNYGKLSHLGDIGGLSSCYRGDGNIIKSEKKKQITDFALWKFGDADKQRLMERVFDGDRAGYLIIMEERPKEWLGNVVKRDKLTENELKTKGFPGRHIECSAMSYALLGKQFDIHTGGVDHIPVHHNNEIAQSECALGVKSRVSYWMHQQFLNIDGKKMSKSKGHDLSILRIVEKGYHPLDIRYFYLTAHYRSFLDFTWGALDQSSVTRKKMIDRIFRQILTKDRALNFVYQGTHFIKNMQNVKTGSLYRLLGGFMKNDLDTVQVLSLIHKSLRDASDQDIIDIIVFDVMITKLGIFEEIFKKVTKYSSTQEVPNDIRELADRRLVAKREKDWCTADKLRNELQLKGRKIIDTEMGYKLEKF